MVLTKGHELYQVFSEGINGSLVVDDFDNYEEACETYYNQTAFLMLGIDAPTAFEVIFAKPYGISLIS